MPSAKPEIVVIGVLSSCDTFAINTRRFVSDCSSESAMELKASVSSPISSVLSVGSTRTFSSPRPKRRAASAMSRRGLAKYLELA